MLRGEMDTERMFLKFSFFKGNLLTLAVSSAFTSLGIGMIGVYLPKYFLSLGGNTLTLGFVGAASAGVQFCALFLGGIAADRYGRKGILVAAAFYGILAPFLYFLLNDWCLFATVTIVAAFSAVSLPAWHAVVADSIPPEKRSSGIAALQVFSSLPQVVAPLGWGWLIDSLGWIDGFKVGCLYSLALGMIAALVLWFFMRETLKKPVTPESPSQLSSSLTSKVGLGEVRLSLSTSLKALMIAYSLVMFANAAVGQYYIIYATDIIQLSAFQWSMIVSFQFLLASLLRIPGGMAADKFGKRRVLIASVLLCSPFTILFTFSSSFIQVLVVLLLLVAAGIYYGAAHEALQADLTPKSVRGRIAALWSMSSALGVASGRFAGGWIFQTVSPSAPFYLFPVAELAALVFLFIGVKEPLTKEE
jgi:MFS family permease